MRLRCEGCGHTQEIRRDTKKARCSVCHSRRFTEYVDQPYTDNGSRLQIKEGKIKEGTRREKEDIKKERKEQRVKEEEERKRRRDNELVHQGGKKNIVKVGEEVLLGVGSLVGEKNPRGHFSKAFINLTSYLEKKRFLREHGGDVRILGDNTRILLGGRKGLLGLEILNIGEDGVVGKVEKKGQREGDKKREKEEVKEGERGTYY